MAVVEPIDAAEGGRRLRLRNPATLEPVGEIDVADGDEVRAAVERARKAQPEWAGLGFRERGRYLERAVKVLRAFDGVVEQATEDELANAAAQADRAGLYTCPQTGVALAALFKLVRRGDVMPKDRVVVISTAHGLKFTRFKVDYHDKALSGATARHANPPIELPADVKAVRGAIERRIGSFRARRGLPKAAG